MSEVTRTVCNNGHEKKSGNYICGNCDTPSELVNIRSNFEHAKLTIHSNLFFYRILKNSPSNTVSMLLTLQMMTMEREKNLHLVKSVKVRRSDNFYPFYLVHKHLFELLFILLDRKLTTWECYNLILRGLVDELIELGAHTRLRKTAFQLWALFLHKEQVAFFSRTEEKLPSLPVTFKNWYNLCDITCWNSNTFRNYYHLFHAGMSKSCTVWRVFVKSI